MPIGNGAVLIGMSERTQGRMIEQVAKALFAKGAADRVIACVMTKDRAHMHLDTVFTLLDRDKATAYPKVVGRHPSHQPAARREGRRLPRHRGARLHRRGRRRARRRQAPRRRDRRRRVPAGARAVGRRQQRRRPRTRRRRGLRAQHLHDRQDARGGRRGGRDRRLRARQGPRRRALHDLPDPAGRPRWLTRSKPTYSLLEVVIAAIAALAIVGAARLGARRARGRRPGAGPRRRWRSTVVVDGAGRRSS